MLNVAAARVAPACRMTTGTPRPATGGRSEAAIAERRTVQKSGWKPENWYHHSHARSMPEQQEGLPGLDVMWGSPVGRT
jgi:hypothetical protein